MKFIVLITFCISGLFSITQQSTELKKSVSYTIISIDSTLTKCYRIVVRDSHLAEKIVFSRIEGSCKGKKIAVGNEYLLELERVSPDSLVELMFGISPSSNPPIIRGEYAVYVDSQLVLGPGEKGYLTSSLCGITCQK